MPPYAAPSDDENLIYRTDKVYNYFLCVSTEKDTGVLTAPCPGISGMGLLDAGALWLLFSPV